MLKLLTLKQYILMIMLMFSIAFFGGTTMVNAADIMDPENTILLDLKDGQVVIKLRPDLAPKHVERIKELTRKGFYNGVVFHRVIDGFMAQTGDPTGTGTGGSGQKLDAEFSQAKHLRGTVSMARASDPNSADSQFFICFADSSFLDGQYTVWGEVIEGMEYVDAIKKGTGNNGKVDNPDSVIKMQVAADVKAQAPAVDATTTAPAVTAPQAEVKPAEGGAAH